jgi:molybdopterin converting factor small subunit
MARLRLFANLRESAGTSIAEVPGTTVAEVLAAAAGRFGTSFERGLASAAVWVNGESASGSTPVSEDDEVALIPPVSGGTSVVRSPAAIEIGLVVALAVALVIANSLSLQWLAVTVVLAGGVWAYDLADFAARRGVPIGAVPLVLGISASALATYRYGIPGTATATVGAGLAALTWSVLNPRLRPIESVAATAVVTAGGAFGAGSLILLRLRNKEEVFAYLLVAAVAVAAMWVAGRVAVAGFDPLVVGVVAALGGGVVAGLLWGDEVWHIVVASAGAALGLVAGRNLGSLLRAGGFYLVETVPGSLHYFDGVIVAVAPFWLVLRLIA